MTRIAEAIGLKEKQKLDAASPATPRAFTHYTHEGLIERLLESEAALAKCQAELAALGHKKKYGLVWEEKEEEFDRQTVGKIPLLTRLSDLTVAGQEGKPTHVLIRGDNYHALRALAFTHERAVDVIYIDPPYNTGNKDFKYNDKFVDKEDGYRHSKWLSFMAKRLRLAKTLLRDTGIIFVSIDANEHAQLKLLCDDVFGEANMLADMVWHNSSRTSDFIAVEHEYILVYAKSATRGAAWKTPRIEAGYLTRVIKDLRTQGATKDEAEAALRQEIASIQRNAADPRSVKWLDNYRTLDADWRIFYPVDLSGEGAGPARTFGGVSIPAPLGRHWMGQDYIDDLTQSGRIVWRGDRAYRKLFIEESMDGLKSIVSTPGRQGTATLKDILGRDMFNNPKPVDLLTRLLRYYPNAAAVVLDFFAGSGSTGHAVMQLNAQDGGTRQCILVTNDEGEFRDEDKQALSGGICTHVTYPRLRKVIEGYVTTTGKAVEGLGESLAFFETEFTSETVQTRARKLALLANAVDLLTLKEACFQEVETGNKRWRQFTNDQGRHLVALFDDLAGDECAEAIAQLQGEVKVYAFAQYEDDDTAESFKHLPNVTVTSMPEALLSANRRTQKPDTK